MGCLDKCGLKSGPLFNSDEDPEALGTRAIIFIPSIPHESETLNFDTFYRPLEIKAYWHKRNQVGAILRVKLNLDSGSFVNEMKAHRGENATKNMAYILRDLL